MEGPNKAKINELGTSNLIHQQPLAFRGGFKVKKRKNAKINYAVRISVDSISRLSEETGVVYRHIEALKPPRAQPHESDIECRRTLGFQGADRLVKPLVEAARGKVQNDI
ncbi:11095_t:CDS:2 [Acaulospora morrowiae]|uniref:11095_t:CDS:1 n=1 Tax=Acaulospora morrowiae TaxID=94023 RepID=A0A9N9HTR8_9GLOM|nr:11095_t:CDS:2 [Acaulospora morrowiae]